MKPRNLLWVVALAALLGSTSLRAQEGEFDVKLLTPLSTETSQKGDKLTAQVLSPQQYQGDFMGGQVRESKSGKKIKGKSVLGFYFDTLHHGDKTIAIESSVKSMMNSKKQADVDEEGNVIEKKNNLGKAAAATGAGALIGALAGGGKGAAIGAGVGAAAALVFIEVGTKAPSISFAAGSEFVLDVKKH